MASMSACHYPTLSEIPLLFSSALSGNDWDKRGISSGSAKNIIRQGRGSIKISLWRIPVVKDFSSCVEVLRTSEILHSQPQVLAEDRRESCWDLPGRQISMKLSRSGMIYNVNSQGPCVVVFKYARTEQPYQNSNHSTMKFCEELMSILREPKVSLWWFNFRVIDLVGLMLKGPWIHSTPWLNTSLQRQQYINLLPYSCSPDMGHTILIKSWRWSPSLFSLQWPPNNKEPFILSWEVISA